MAVADHVTTRNEKFIPPIVNAVTTELTRALGVNVLMHAVWNSPHRGTMSSQCVNHMSGWQRVI